MNRFAVSHGFLVALSLVVAKVWPTTSAVSCQTGWSSQIQEIPQDWINDGYCDCPLDAADEPNTDACSGSTVWPGIPSSSLPAATFSCPQQPALKLPLSRLRDGICDCCDGVDEAPGLCTDKCDEVLREEREARARLEQGFAIGQNKRKHELYGFKKLREEKLKEIQELQQQLESLDPTVPLSQMHDLQLAYLSQRMTVGTGLLAAAAEGSSILDGLSGPELTTVLALICQLAGEMALDEETNTCVALRLAGLEMGMTWPEDWTQDPAEFKIQTWNSTSLELATRVFANVANEQRLWKLDAIPDKQYRRRLEELPDFDEDFHDYEGGYHDDDYLRGEDLDNRNKEKPIADVQTPSSDSLSGLEKELVDKVQALPFSVTRNAFLTRAKEIMDQIASVLAAQSSDLPEEEDKAEEETPKEKEIAPTFDPVAYNMLRSTLQRKISTLTKGFNWGASSFLFTSANSDLTEDQLRQLAMYTIYHGKISALQVWQVLQVAVDELFVPPPTTDSETCSSPWTSSCPPKSMKRKGITIPNSSLIQAAEKFCSAQTEVTMASCAASAVDANNIPTTIPEGYYGYSAPVPRDQEDPIATIFAPLTALPVDKVGFESLQKEQDRLDKEKKNLEKKIADAWKEIGGKNGDEMGPNGELYSFANKCFEVQAGKYTYEVCVFGQATQKDEAGGGTGLGKFTRMHRDEETGQRILLWENGQKCWNGPHRSATVYLTCGPDNKVLSADEPDTCRYVLQMESYIACDDEYKQRMGI